MGRSEARVEKGICYLCGRPIVGKASVDHVPPKQFFPADYRRARKDLQLLTLKAHNKCNGEYTKDEDYFVYAMSALASQSPIARSLLDEMGKKYTAGRQTPLFRQTLREFELRPGGLILPPGRIVKRFNGARAFRIVWKIIRGLYFHHFDRVVPADAPSKLIRICSPLEEPSDDDKMMLARLPSQGAYPDVFDYKFEVHSDVGLCYWALLLWGDVIVTFAFQAPHINLGPME